MKKAFTIVILLATVAMILWGISRPWREDRAWRELVAETSELPPTSRTITILGDDWLGYLVFRSREFQLRLAEQGIRTDFRMEPDFDRRIEALRSGKADFIVATLDSYLLNGGKFGWPGVAVFVIDESFGGDAVIARPPIESVDDLNAPSVSGAFVGESPSEFLITSQASHFKLDALMPRLEGMRVASAEQAYAALASGEVDFAVLWEPFTSRALAEIDGTRKLVDTRDAQGIIIDLALASREVLAEEPGLVEQVIHAYFATLHTFLNDPSEFQAAAARDSGKDADDASTMLSGIRFVPLDENRSQWLGRSGRLAERAFSILEILRDAGKTIQPPAGDVRSLLNTSALAQVSSRPESVPAVAPRFSEAGTPFDPWGEAEWAAAAENVRGTLLDEPITFRPGSTEIPEAFRELVRESLPKLQHYPTHRLIVEAHVAPGDDAEGAVTLSKARAESVKRFLVEECGLPAARVHTIGAGDASPPERLEEEDYRAWQRRARRARVMLVGEES